MTEALWDSSSTRASLAVLGRVRRRVAVETFDVFVRTVTDADREFAPPDGYAVVLVTAPR